MSRGDIIKSSVAQVYSHPRIVKHYAKRHVLGLHEAEGRIIERYCTTPGKLLDIGCGVGRISVALARKGHDVQGVDISEGMVRKARQLDTQHLVTYRTGDIASITLAKGVFDYALFLSAGICHIPFEEMISVLRRIYDALRPGGVFIFSCYIRPTFLLPLRLSSSFFLTSMRMLLHKGIFPRALSEYYRSKIHGVRSGYWLYHRVYTISHMRSMLPSAALALEYFTYGHLLCSDYQKEKGIVLFVCRTR
jgi:2-polyprenyl-3-methyl-5-hydroxy-6-metoxy-1,4-benzoquinol methylase